MELFEAIRRDARREELSIRQLAVRHGVHRRTVRAAVASPVPPARRPRESPAPKLDPVKPLIDAMLREDLTAPRKQQHTARRVLARLVDERTTDPWRVLRTTDPTVLLRGRLSVLDVAAPMMRSPMRVVRRWEVPAISGQDERGEDVEPPALRRLRCPAALACGDVVGLD